MTLTNKEVKALSLLIMNGRLTFKQLSTEGIHRSTLNPLVTSGLITRFVVRGLVTYESTPLGLHILQSANGLEENHLQGTQRSPFAPFS